MDSYKTVDSFESFFKKFQESPTSLEADSLLVFEVLLELVKNKQPTRRVITKSQLGLLQSFLKLNRLKQTIGITSQEISLLEVDNFCPVQEYLFLFPKGQKYILNLSAFWQNFLELANEGSFLKAIYNLDLPIQEFYLVVSFLSVQVFPQSKPYIISDLQGLVQQKYPFKLSKETKEKFEAIKKSFSL